MEQTARAGCSTHHPANAGEARHGRMVEEQADFTVSSMKKRGPRNWILFSTRSRKPRWPRFNSVDEQKFSVSLLHGVTGSGKTAVYLAAMQAVLEKGRVGDSAGPGDWAYARSCGEPASDIWR